MKNNELLELFKIPNIVVNVPTLWLLKKSMIDSKLLFNAHLMVRYRAIDDFYNGRKKWWDIYNEMQKKRVSQNLSIPRDKMDNETSFKKLICSIEKNGFDYKYPIVINKNFRLVDGSHRLALALYFKMEYVPVLIDEKSYDFEKDYSLKWFIDNGFEYIIDDIHSTYNEIVGEK